MVNESPNLTIERIESLKAGTIAAVSFTLAYSLLALGNTLLAQQFEELVALQVTTPVTLIMRVAIAGLSGLLFGVTYRYVVRDDKNSQLKAGAVLAFGLVRGLALVDVQQNLMETFWLLSVLGVENVLCFAIAQFTLDWAIRRHWVKPFS